MHTFRLTFQGEIARGYDAAQVRREVAAALGLEDQQQLERYFSGEMHCLREGMDRKQAADLYRRLDEAGAQVKLERSTKRPDTNSVSARGLRTPATVRKRKPDTPLQRHPAGLAHKPNYFLLTPYRQTRLRQARALAASRARRAALLFGLLTAVTLLAAVRYLPAIAPSAPPSGPKAMSPLNDGGLALILEEQLLLLDQNGTDRASLLLEDLGLSRLERLLPWGEQRPYVAVARGLHAQQNAIWHCWLEETRCAVLDTGRTAPQQLVLHPGRDLQLQIRAGQLERSDTSGQILDHSTLRLPVSSLMRIHSGLLYLAHAQTPALSVLRYDQGALGEQLDELLLLAPPALANKQEIIIDLAKSATSWWALLESPRGDSTGLYRFDQHWGYLTASTLPADFKPRQITPWKGGLLLLDPDHRELLHLTQEGKIAGELRSKALEQLITRQGTLISIHARGSELISFLLGLLSLASFLYAGLQHWRWKVYSSIPVRSAAPLGSEAATYFLALAPARTDAKRRLHIALAAIATISLGVGLLLRVEASLLGALLVVLGSTYAALTLLLRSSPGHVGIRGNALLLVNHRGYYHLDRVQRAYRRGPFVGIDDVLVYTGQTGWPVFSSAAMQQHLEPLLSQARRAGTGELLVRLWEQRDPLLLATGTLLAGFLAAALLLLLSQ